MHGHKNKAGGLGGRSLPHLQTQYTFVSRVLKESIWVLLLCRVCFVCFCCRGGCCFCYLSLHWPFTHLLVCRGFTCRAVGPGGGVNFALVLVSGCVSFAVGAGGVVFFAVAAVGCRFAADAVDGGGGYVLLLGPPLAVRSLAA